jgi:tetratricopeptide (TPR) repeat protein
MKLFSALAILLLALALPQARAQQNPDDQYVAIYGEIQQADSLQASGQPRQALAGFVAAQTELQKFHKMYPDWDGKIVTYRLNYLAEKTASLIALLPPLTNALPQTGIISADTNTSAADLQSQLAGLRGQVQGLQSDNTTLQAKLKEALTVQPAAVDSGELAKAQAQIVSLMKQVDLLKAGAATNAVEIPAPNSDLTNLQAQVASLQSQLEVASLEKIALQTRIKQLQSAQKNGPTASDTELTSKVNTLQARLAADEAPAVPYTADEQALLKQPEPQPATNSEPAQKSINELPPGSAQLVAEAQNYFAAKQYDKAAEDYQKILQADPNNALALGNLAAIELQQGKLDAAETHINAALAQTPDDSYDLSILGYVKFRQEKFDDSLDALSRAAKLDPQNAEIQNYLGVTLSHKGLRDQAEKAWRKAVQIDPDYAAAHNNLAVIYISDNPPAPELARYHYQKALDAGQPHNPDLEKLLAEKGAPVDAK